MGLLNCFACAGIVKTGGFLHAGLLFIGSIQLAKMEPVIFIFIQLIMCLHINATWLFFVFKIHLFPQCNKTLTVHFFWTHLLTLMHNFLGSHCCPLSIIE